MSIRFSPFLRTVAIGITTGAIFCAGMVMGSRLHPEQRPAVASPELISQLNQLDAQMKQLRGSDLQPSNIVALNRNSICFILSTYTLAEPGADSASTHYRLLATGFLVSGNTVVSNRHVLEPWFGDPRAEKAIRLGAVPSRGKIIAYFPSLDLPVELSHVVASQAADLAVAHVDLPASAVISPLRLASQPSLPGEAVVVMGYPLGVTTMLAKTAAVPYQISALRQDEREVGHLAQFKLIRPTATQGHLADASGTTLIYDASTAHGSSGGPVFNMRGEVIGVNAALMSGFAGTSLGVSTAALQPLLDASKKLR